MLTPVLFLGLVSSLSDEQSKGLNFSFSQLSTSLGIGGEEVVCPCLQQAKVAWGWLIWGRSAGQGWCLIPLEDHIWS